MWPKWLRSPRWGVPSSPKSPSHFCFSSFKDVQTILKEEHGPEPESPHHHPKKPSIFHRTRTRTRTSSSELINWPHRNSFPSSEPSIKLPNGVILYFTSLRVVRKTFEDCNAVRSILRGYCVPVDERDLSMDDKLKDELLEIMKLFNKKIKLPSVFIDRRYIGGAEEIKHLHESGELRKLIGELPYVGSLVCDLCGGLQFVVCEECNGSHKIYTEKWEFRSCTACNTNGLVKCPSCCPVFHRCSSSYY